MIYTNDIVNSEETSFFCTTYTEDKINISIILIIESYTTLDLINALLWSV